MTSRYAELLRGAEAIAARAAQTLCAMRDGALDVSRKELRDVVTAADLASERVVLEGLRTLTPDAAILSEEAGASGPTGGGCWIVDPLDGTVNYAAGLPWFSVTLAYTETGRTRAGVVHAPLVDIVARYCEDGIATINGRTARVSARDSLADAVVSIVLTSHFSDTDVVRTSEAVRRLGSVARGVRIIVSGGLEMTLVADGQLDAFVSLKADVVSHAAAMPLVRAAGGRVTRLDGTDATDDDLERVVTNGRIHDELLACLRDV
ncbi:MAG TPA: inositol monophosphatase [Casimicrobiaceae bacterium]|nr:inositol monophosphatase [Casimicrobiaceae bacterium]